MATSKKPATKATPAKKIVSAPKAAASKTAKPKAPKTQAPAPSTVGAAMPKPVFNIEEINNLMKAVNNSNVSELKLEKGDFKITIRQGGYSVQASSAPTQIVHAAPAPASVAAPAPVAPAAAPAPTPVAAAPSTDDNLVTIKSPMIGTFYRAAGPGKPVFVNVGDDIKTGQVLCIVEAMKLFNEIESEINGKIVKVLVDDASPIEYDQPLFLVQPS